MVSYDSTNDLHNLKHELVMQMFPEEAGTDVSAFGVGVDAETPTLARHVPSGGNVVGVGLGAKETASGVGDELAVRVYVRTKLPARTLLAESTPRVPPEVNGTPTDVVAVGDVTVLRPVSCGGSVGHYNITAGTLGCLVERYSDEERPGVVFILSNNHVLADVNSASIGDPVIEPGPADGGSMRIGELADFEPIRMNGPDNVIDAAIAAVDDPADVTPDITAIGRVTPGTSMPQLFQSVRKHGRTTRHTVGVVMDLSADLWVGLGGQRKAWFVDQLDIVGAGSVFSQPGDSGSLVVDSLSVQPVGLLFAGGGGHTFANPIDPVLQRFGVTVV